MAASDIPAGHCTAPETVSFEYIRSGGRRSTFAARLVLANHEVIAVSHVAHLTKPLRHDGEAVMESGYTVVWFLFKDRPYDVGRFYRPDGTWTGSYVDILEPVRWDNDNPRSIAPLVDLALDLWIAPDSRYQVLDEDEFEQAVRQGDLTQSQAQHARTTLDDLIALIENGKFPPQIARDYSRGP